MTALSVVGAQWRLRPQDCRLLWGTFMPWALRAGAHSPDLLTLYYEKHFDVRLASRHSQLTSEPSDSCKFFSMSDRAEQSAQESTTIP